MRKPLAYAASALLLALALALLLTQARPAHNHQALYLPSPHAAPGQPMPTLCAAGDINVNTASAAELARISGIGPSLAQAIIDERSQNGAFVYPADLLTLRGIGRSTLNKLLPQIRLE